MSSATPDASSVPDWLDASQYHTIAARRFADFYRQTLHAVDTDADAEDVAASDASSAHAIQEEAAQLILQRLDALGKRSKPEQAAQDDVQGDQNASEAAEGQT